MADSGLPPGTPRTVLHVGMHKTGSTSIQQLLRDEGALLASVGASFPAGFLIPSLHSDLPLLVLRPGRTWPARLRFPETDDPAWQRAAADHIRRAVAGAPQPVVVWSHEDLSYVRHDDELSRLRELLGDAPVQVVVYHRRRADFLRSYRDQLQATGFELSDDQSSFAYVQPDSWVADQDAVIETYRRGFGHEHVFVVDYDDALQRDGSVIPSFAELLGIAPADLPPLDRYFLNQSGAQLRLSDEGIAAVRRRAIEQSGR